MLAIIRVEVIITVLLRVRIFLITEISAKLTFDIEVYRESTSTHVLYFRCSVVVNGEIVNECAAM